MQCLKCNGEMEEGISVDTTGGAYTKGKWGSKISWLYQKIENRKNIITYRCKNCGYLESYAK